MTVLIAIDQLTSYTVTPMFDIPIVKYLVKIIYFIKLYIYNSIIILIYQFILLMLVKLINLTMLFIFDKCRSLLWSKSKSLSFYLSN
jgi:hypothetical protein